MQLLEWLHSLPESPTPSQAADHAGVSKATFLRHVKRDETTAEYAITIARAYNVNPIDALIDLGMLDEQELKRAAARYSGQRMTNQELLDEIMRRSDPEAVYLFGGDADVIDISDTPLHAVADSSPEEGEGFPGDYEP
ncbi:helix-turn-helix domain-containing protein [Corynebacterium sanguinis]|uniref:helix-turn-helix domain-containing protein n=1 Tax=Corynebacterium sanguinis TaxID=2594913 RepID=UPI0021A9256F|nr:helix-turn-helix domain-containing protein [Corynebacterium sanguinis]MCT1411690.1 hypothetical protein [Corynebacterium sanguinis]